MTKTVISIKKVTTFKYYFEDTDLDHILSILFVIAALATKQKKMEVNVWDLQEWGVGAVKQLLAQVKEM